MNSNRKITVKESSSNQVQNLDTSIEEKDKLVKKRKTMNSYRKIPVKENSSNQIQNLYSSRQEKKSLFMETMTPREKNGTSLLLLNKDNKEGFQSTQQLDFSNQAKNVSVFIPAKFM